jgi:hypothetical protein
MNMKSTKITLLLCAVFCLCTARAQDAVHGVNGYYAYTVKQIQREGKMVVQNGNGFKYPKRYSFFVWRLCLERRRLEKAY